MYIVPVILPRTGATLTLKNYEIDLTSESLILLDTSDPFSINVSCFSGWCVMVVEEINDHHQD